MNKHFTRKHRIIFAMVMIALLIAIAFTTLLIDNHYAYDLQNKGYIFNNITDLDFLDEHITKNHMEDKELLTIQPNNRKCAQLEYNDETYTIYAYVFESKEDAWEYAKRISNNHYQLLYEEFGQTNFRYRKTRNILGIYVNRKTMLVSENKVLLMEGTGNSKKYSEFIGFVMENLPQKIDYK